MLPAGRIAGLSAALLLAAGLLLSVLLPDADIQLTPDSQVCMLASRMIDGIFNGKSCVIAHLDCELDFTPTTAMVSLVDRLYFSLVNIGAQI